MISPRLNAILASVVYPIGGLVAGLAASLATLSNIVSHGPAGALVAAASVWYRAAGTLLLLAADLHSLLLP